MATAAEYSWIDSWANGLLTVGYCVILINELSPATVLDRLDVTERAVIKGAAATNGPALAAWDNHGGRGCYVAVTEVSGWALMVEINGWLGSDPAVLVPLSAGTTIVSHYRNVNALDQFTWVEDGSIRVRFEPLFPTVRSGAAPADIELAMRAVGFDLSEGEDRRIEGHTAAAFALAEHLTGIRVTPDLLDESSYLCGVAMLPTS